MILNTLKHGYTCINKMILLKLFVFEGDVLKAKRLAAAYIDMYISAAIVIFIDILLDILNVKFTFPILVLELFVGIIFGFKDFVYGNASIGKHLLGFEIVSTSGKKITYTRLFLRNCVFSVIWPIESILILLYNKRLGDYIFKTSVVEALKADNE